MSLLKLNIGILSIIFGLLKRNINDQHAFASTSQVLWSIFTRVRSNNSLTLNGSHITALELNTLTSITIKNKFYKSNFLKHVFTFAKYLKRVRIAERMQYSKNFFKVLFCNFSTDNSNFTLEISKDAKKNLVLARLKFRIPKSIAIRFDGDDKDYDSDDDLPESFHIRMAKIKEKLISEYAMNNPYELIRNSGVLYPSLLSVFDTLDDDSEEEDL